MKIKDNLEIFRSAPVPRAVLQNALPAIAAMLMVLIYQLADTFFIGQTHNDILVASISLTTPVFLIFMSVGTIFGIGGTSVISRALGEGRTEYAKKVCAFCMWSCVVVGTVLGIIYLIFMDGLLTLMGASADTWQPTKTYMVIVSFSAPFVLVANCYNNIIRAEGKSGQAMIGQVIGNLLNVVLDPIMISVLGWGIAGAAIATVIGNIAGAVYYILFFVCKRSSLSISIRKFTLKDRICRNVLAIGVPASMGSMMMSISQIVANSRMASHDDMALAGLGVAMKVVMIASLVCVGLGQGVQPLLGYCVGAGLWNRFKKVMRFSLIFSLGLGTVMTGVCYIFTGAIIRAFLTDAAAFDYAEEFVRILLITGFLFGVFHVLGNALQGMGAAGAALIINLSRQGIIYIPLLLLLESLLGITGLVWAQPVSDILSTALVAVLYIFTRRKMERSAALAKPAVQ